jgi:hypothetical protein
MDIRRDGGKPTGHSRPDRLGGDLVRQIVTQLIENAVELRWGIRRLLGHHVALPDPAVLAVS